MKAVVAMLLVSAIAFTGCGGGNVGTTPQLFPAALPTVEITSSSDPVVPLTDTGVVGTTNGQPVVPLLVIPTIQTNLGASGMAVWGTKDFMSGAIGSVTQATVYGLEPPGGQVHVFFNAAQLPVYFSDDATGYGIAINYTSANSLTVTLCDSAGNALGQDSATISGGVAQGPDATDGGSCTVNLGGITSTANAQTVASTTAGVPTDTSAYSELLERLSSGSYFAGLVFTIGAIRKLRQHKDNPTQAPLVTAIALLFVATALFFLPSILKAIASALFGSAAISIDGVLPFYQSTGPPGAIYTTP